MFCSFVVITFRLWRRSWRVLPLLQMRKAYSNWAKDCSFVFWPGRSQFPNYHTFPGLFKCAVQYTKYIDLWGAHIVDCVSAYYNHKLPKFSSRLWSPNTAGVDFFQPVFTEGKAWWSTCLYYSACATLCEILVRR